MGINKLFAWAVSLFLIFTGINSAFAAGDNIVKGPPIPGLEPETEVQWVWGELSSVDPANKKIVLRYLDYDTDMEKEISLTADPQVIYDNFNSLQQLKPGDNISVDYITNDSGINIAKEISIENPEDLQTGMPAAPVSTEGSSDKQETDADMSK